MYKNTLLLPPSNSLDTEEFLICIERRKHEFYLGDGLEDTEGLQEECYVTCSLSQYSCLETSLDRGAWWTTAHGVAKCWTRLSTHMLEGRERDLRL